MIAGAQFFARISPCLAFFLAGAASAQVGSAIAMPIDDPKDRSDGPAIAALWAGPCKDCTEAPGLHRAYAAARDAVVTGAPGTRAALRPRKVVIVSFTKDGPGGYGMYQDKDASLDAVHDRLKGCRIAAEDMLPRPPKSHMDSYGVGLNCPGQEMRVFMSLSFEKNHLETVYLMPDRPFFVQMAPAAAEAKN